LADKKSNTMYDNGIGWGIALIAIAFLTWLFWHFQAENVRDMVRWVRYGEMWLISFFIDNDYTVLYKKQPVNWEQGFKLTPRWRAGELSYGHLAYFGALTMQPLRPLFLILCALAAFWCMLYGPSRQHRSSFDLEGLIRAQAKNFPVIAPFVKFNPAKQKPRPPGSPVPAELPLFAEALGPEEWLAYNSIPAPDGKIDEQAAAKAFEQQLEGRWKGSKGLEPYQQILLASFCLKASRKRTDSDDMLSRLALCWSEGGLKLNRDRPLLRDARRVLRDSDLAGKTLSQCNRHAFVTTAMMRALFFARSEGGVLAPAQFVWLRGHNRALWYALNNLGRQSYHMEALGAMAHFKAERLTQRPIPVPKMEDGVKTLKEYMTSLRARPIPQLDYSGSKKKGIKAAK
jgi:intracellular multiplication protein IcmP